MGCSYPIFVSPTNSLSLNRSACFSLTRPSVVFIGKDDGQVDIWDYADQTFNPAQQHLVSATGITHMTINPNKPNLIAAGDQDGCLHLIQLPNNLVYCSKSELQGMEEYLRFEV